MTPTLNPIPQSANESQLSNRSRHRPNHSQSDSEDGGRSDFDPKALNRGIGLLANNELGNVSSVEPNYQTFGT